MNFHFPYMSERRDDLRYPLDLSKILKRKLHFMLWLLGGLEITVQFANNEQHKSSALMLPIIF